jgi:AraC-like DNA-binding protein
MRLVTLTPSPQIAPWIHHFWIFQSPLGLPADDLRVVVPNGRHKLIVPFRNGLTARTPARAQHNREGDAVLIGLWERPTTLSSPAAETVTIGVEFLPHGLRRFFPGIVGELSERIVPVDDALGRAGRELTRRVMDLETPEAAAAVVDAFLVQRLRAAESPGQPVIDAAVRMLVESGFRLQINELERRMGYSRRYLHALFLQNVGLAPKRLCGVMAFEQLYRRFSQDKSAARLRDDALDVYFDQSHFIRSFKRFTGFSPGAFAELDNEFGRIFYKGTSPRASSQTYNPGGA